MGECLSVSVVEESDLSTKLNTHTDPASAEQTALMKNKMMTMAAQAHQPRLSTELCSSTYPQESSTASSSPKNQPESSKILSSATSTAFVNHTPSSASTAQPGNEPSASTHLPSQGHHTERLASRHSSEKHQGLSTTPSSASKRIVFISHAHEDKTTIAIPLRDLLVQEGMAAFVPNTDSPATVEEEKAFISSVESADIAVVVLSPEFIARKWTMKALMRFSKRHQLSGRVPFILPFYYRISASELPDEPRLGRKCSDGRSLYRASQFLDRMSANEPEADASKIKKVLKELQDIPGVENDLNASNDSTTVMSRRRELLLQDLYHQIQQLSVAEGEGSDDMNDQGPQDIFRTSFARLPLPIWVRLEFDSTNGREDPITSESWVKKHLLDETSGSPGVVAIHGREGIGKSTILRALLFDGQVRERFQDGIHFLRLGKDASTVTLFHQLCNVLKDAGAEKTEQSLRACNNVDEGLEYFESWFYRRSCAFFIDDAWVQSIGIGRLFRLCKLGSVGSRNAVVITTTQREIASLAPCTKIVRLELQESTGEFSRKILASHISQKDIIRNVDVFDAVLNDCAGLPINLTIVGNTLKQMSISMLHGEGGVWEDYLSQLTKSHDYLCRQNVGERGMSFAIFSAAIWLLDEKRRRKLCDFESKLSFTHMFQLLCVLQKGQAVPIAMLKHLWETESEETAEMIARTFFASGLASIDFMRSGNEDEMHFMVHDMVHDFAVAEAKRAGGIQVAHDVLLKNYCSCDRDSSFELGWTCRWWSKKLEPDGYIHQHVCHHLVKAGRSSELFRLLLSPQWTERQLFVNGLLALEVDFALGIKVIRDEIKNANDHESSELEEALGLISEAVELAWPYVRNNFRELWFQLRGRLEVFADRFSAIQEYLSGIDDSAKRPLAVYATSFLRIPTGSKTRKVSVGVRINCMAGLDDEARVVCGCKDGLIFVLNALQSEFEMAWKAHDNSVSSIAVGRGSTRIVSGSTDGTSKLWDLATRSCLAMFHGHTNVVTGVKLMRNDEVVSVSHDGTIQNWGGGMARIVSEQLKFPRNSLLGIAVLEDNSLVITGGNSCRLILQSLRTGSQVGAFEGHHNWITCIAVNPDTQHIASGSLDKTVRIWDVRTHEQIGDSLEGHSDSVQCLAMSKDGRRIVSGSWDWSIRVWDYETRKEICRPLLGHHRVVSGVSFSVHGNFIVSSSWDGTVRAWNIRQEKARGIQNHYGSAIKCISFTPEGRFIVSGSTDWGLQLWDATSGRRVGKPLEGHTGAVNDVAITHQPFVVSVSNDRTVRVWDLKSHSLLRTFTGHFDKIQCIAVTPQGDRAVTGSRDKTVRVWDLGAMDGNCKILEHIAPLNQVFITGDGLRIIGVDEENGVSVWELESMKIIKQLVKRNVERCSRREIFYLVREQTVEEEIMVSIPLRGREIWYGEGKEKQLLATMETDILCWSLSPNLKYICVGLLDGQVGLMKLER